MDKETWDKIREIINDGLSRKDRCVSIYVNPEGAMHTRIIPYPDEDDLWEMFKDGKISMNDYRIKLGLCPNSNVGEDSRNKERMVNRFL